MNITLLNIVAEECCANIRPGQVVACRRPGDAEWHDPWGGLFDEAEQVSLDDLARGNAVTLHLRGVHGPRVFGAHLVAKF